MPMTWLRIATALLLTLVVPACASVDRSVALTEAAVVPITVGDATEVSAIDLSEVMLRAGFTREDILRHGATLHQALATSGGAQMRQGKIVSALFAVHSGRLYVTSRTRGTFVHPLNDGGHGGSLMFSAEQ